jgi:hypothetical protein
MDGLIELLDIRLRCIVISPHYGDVTNNENAGRNEGQSRH